VSPTDVELHLLRVGSCRHPEWVTMRGGRWRPTAFPAIAALIIHPVVGPILYDTGYSERFGEATRRFPERLYRWLTPVRLPPEDRLGIQLARFGVSFDDVRHVVISHLHADHVAGLRDLPRARFLIMERAAAAARLSRWRALRIGVLPGLLPADFAARLDLVDTKLPIDLGPAWHPFDTGYDLLGDGTLVGLALPGHAQAQLGLLLSTVRHGRVLLAADACWSSRALREMRMPSALARLVFDDWTAYRRTLAGLRDVANRQPDLSIVPSHCPAALAAFEAAPRPLAGLAR
jgi:glyoxylase-like metal-dependent hydrolase (beta-lactamase superfamily II)